MFGFGKKKAASRPEQAAYDVDREFLDAITTQVRDSMPAVAGFYVDLLVERIKEAGDDPKEVRFAWDGFAAALADVPRLVEENLRAQHADAWKAFGDAGMGHILSGIVRQEVASFTDPLPGRLLVEITGR